MSASNLMISMDEITDEAWIISIKAGVVKPETLRELQVYGSEEVRRAATEALGEKYIPADEPVDLDSDFYKPGGTD